MVVHLKFWSLRLMVWINAALWFQRCTKMKHILHTARKVLCFRCMFCCRMLAAISLTKRLLLPKTYTVSVNYFNAIKRRSSEGWHRRWKFKLEDDSVWWAGVEFFHYPLRKTENIKGLNQKCLSVKAPGIAVVFKQKYQPKSLNVSHFLSHPP